MVGSGLKDDMILQNAFKKDGHSTLLENICYDEKLDMEYDVIIRRNTWVSSTNDTSDLYENNQALIKRLENKKIKTVNLVGLDGKGKAYLCDLFQDYESVLPTVKSINDFNLLPIAEKYAIKDIKSFGNGLHQKFVTRDEVEKNYIEGDIIQPFMKFKAEIQCYYVSDKLMYCFEYTPSKYPNYPEPRLIELTEEEKELADTFARYSNLKHGFQRIDFLKLEDNSLLLMEIEDHAAFMNLQRLPQELLKKVTDEYTQNIYDLIESK